MNLYELPDKDFDERFRTAANSAGYPFSEAAWSGLEKKLNRWEKLRPWFWPLMGGMVLLILGITFFLLQRNPGIEEAPIATSRIEQGIIGKSPAKGTGAMEQGRAAPGKEKDLNTSDTGNTALDVTGLTDIETNELPGRKSENAGIVSGLKPEAKRAVPDDERDLPDARPEGLSAPEQDTASPLTPPVYLTPRLDLQNNALNEAGFLLSKDGLRGPAAENLPEQSTVIPPGRGKISPGYSLNLMLGPDFSGVGADGYGTGTFAGLGFEIYLGRFSLMTGISHARKKYAVSDEYTVPSSGNSSYMADPDRVQIACHVLDIPINVYYSIIRKGRNRVFAGTGLSTYLMLTEEYHFEYDNGYNSSSSANDLILKNENQHYFGIVNISAGYSRDIGRKWALQVEPYLKLPIQDIAAAKVRLNSFGALFSLKYSIR